MTKHIDFTLEFGDEALAFADLPVASIETLIRRGFSHVMGSEIASKVISRVRSEIVAGTDRLASKVDTSELKTWKAENSELVETWTIEAQEQMFAAIKAGTLGVKKESIAKGVKRNPVEIEARKIALERIVDIFRKSGQKLPTKDAVAVVNGISLTRSQLVERQLVGKYGPAIYAKAKEIVAARANVGEDEAESIDDL